MIKVRKSYITENEKARKESFIVGKNERNSQVMLCMEVNSLAFCHRMFSLSKI